MAPAPFVDNEAGQAGFYRPKIVQPLLHAHGFTRISLVDIYKYLILNTIFVKLYGERWSDSCDSKYATVTNRHLAATDGAR